MSQRVQCVDDQHGRHGRVEKTSRVAVRCPASDVVTKQSRRRRLPLVSPPPRRAGSAKRLPKRALGSIFVIPSANPCPSFSNSPCDPRYYQQALFFLFFTVFLHFDFLELMTTS